MRIEEKGVFSTMNSSGRTAWLVVFLAIFVNGARSDEGIWLPNQFPAGEVQKKYGVSIGQDFLDRLRLASVRVVASASFVSPNGLLLTNHHVASECIQQLSSKEHDYMTNGFYAASVNAEKQCPGMEADVLLKIDDVTGQVAQGVREGTEPVAAARTRQANTAKIEKECAARTGNRCEVVTLYSGGQYHLYQYKKYGDVRLVFAPESSVAAFGGDIDNFTYPRFCLDFTFLRVYENGKPAVTPNYLRWSPTGVRDGELIFVSGHPGATGRLNTFAQLEFFRDVSYPFVHSRLSSLIRNLQAFSAKSAENKRVAADNLSSQQNSFKAYTGFLAGLRDESLMSAKREEEKTLREAVNRDPEMRKRYGAAWDAIAASYNGFRQEYRAYWLLETAATRGSELMRIARNVIRLAEERGKPNGTRLKDYRDSALPSLEASLFATVPISSAMEIAVLADYFEFMRGALGADDLTVQAVLAKKSPAEAARRFVSASRLADIAERKRLATSAAAVRKSDDGMIRLALLLDGRARELRKKYEDTVEAVLALNVSRVAQARYRVRDGADYPDATSTLRISFGPVRGYETSGGQWVPYATNFEGLFRRATGVDPFVLPKRWVDAQDAVDPATPFNFVSTADTHGGNSGSPTVNASGDFVGILFDGNLESLPNRFLYTEERSRSVHVSSLAIAEALRKVYRATSLLGELGVTPPGGGMKEKAPTAR